MPNIAGPKVKLTDYQIDFVLDNFMPHSKKDREGFKRYATGIKAVAAFNCMPDEANGKARLYRRLVSTKIKLDEYEGGR